MNVCIYGGYVVLYNDLGYLQMSLNFLIEMIFAQDDGVEIINAANLETYSRFVHGGRL